MTTAVTRSEGSRSPSRHERICFSGGAWLSVLDRLPTTFPSRTVALTFDDGPAATTPALLDTLAAYGAGATFFLLGERAAEEPQLVEEIVGQGHAVYAHGFSHRRFTLMSADQIIDEMNRAEQVLARFRPTPSRYLVRLPHGSGADHPRIHRALRTWHRGAQIARWTISTQDYELSQCGQGCAVDSEIGSRLQQLFDGPHTIDRSIILLHEDPYGVAGPDAADDCLAMAFRLMEALSDREYAMAPLLPGPESSPLSRFVYFHKDDLQLGRF